MALCRPRSKGLGLFLFPWSLSREAIRSPVKRAKEQLSEPLGDYGVSPWKLSARARTPLHNNPATTNSVDSAWRYRALATCQALCQVWMGLI